MRNLAICMPRPLPGEAPTNPLSADPSDRPQSQQPIKRPSCTPCAYCLGPIEYTPLADAHTLNATGSKHERGRRFFPGRSLQAKK